VSCHTVEIPGMFNYIKLSKKERTMKNLIKSIIAIIVCSFIFSRTVRAKAVCQVYSKADTTIDPKKNPGTIDLVKHPEVMAKVLDNVKSGKVRFEPKVTTDTTLNLDKHPELVKALINDPAHWPAILKPYVHDNVDTATAGKNKQVIRDIIANLIAGGVVNERSDINFFLLTNNELIVNGKKMQADLHDALSKKYVKDAGFRIYYGPESFTGHGIFQKSDRL
jgi:hypothetical protein